MQVEASPIVGPVQPVLPRFGITLTGLMQKILALLPLIRALLPF